MVGWRMVEWWIAPPGSTCNQQRPGQARIHNGLVGASPLPRRRPTPRRPTTGRASPADIEAADSLPTRWRGLELVSQLLVVQLRSSRSGCVQGGRHIYPTPLPARPIPYVPTPPPPSHLPSPPCAAARRPGYQRHVSSSGSIDRCVQSWHHQYIRAGAAAGRTPASSSSRRRGSPSPPCSRTSPANGGAGSGGGGGGSSPCCDCRCRWCYRRRCCPHYFVESQPRLAKDSGTSTVGRATEEEEEEDKARRPRHTVQVLRLVETGLRRRSRDRAASTTGRLYSGLESCSNGSGGQGQRSQMR